MPTTLSQPDARRLPPLDLLRDLLGEDYGELALAEDGEEDLDLRDDVAGGRHFHRLARIEEGALHVDDEQRGLPRRELQVRIKRLGAIHEPLSQGARGSAKSDRLQWHSPRLRLARPRTQPSARLRLRLARPRTQPSARLRLRLELPRRYRKSVGDVADRLHAALVVHYHRHHVEAAVLLAQPLGPQIALRELAELVLLAGVHASLGRRRVLE